MAEAIPISKVPKDVSNRETKQVYNPLNIDFVHKFDGDEEILTSGEWTILPAPVAVHMSRHLAKRIVLDIASDEREKLLEKTDSKHYVSVAERPYPRFDKRVGDVAKDLICDVNEKEEIDPEVLLEKAKENDSDKKKKRGKIMLKPKAKEAKKPTVKKGKPPVKKPVYKQSTSSIAQAIKK